MKFKKEIILSVIIGALVIYPIVYMMGVKAEQSGTSPESGSVSKIKELYDKLVLENKGNDETGSWGDAGSMWNRIYSAADSAVDYSLQQYEERDDYAGTYNGGVAPEDYQEEEAVWTDYSVGAELVWKDERTGVYWSANRVGTATNIFTAMSLNTCDFFNEELYEKRGDYSGNDPDCRDAINYCATLEYGGRTDWYLPTHKELLMAYIDGVYNKAGTTPANAASFAFGSVGQANSSSSESSGYPTYAWSVMIWRGSCSAALKTTPIAVRCVSRD